MYRCFVLAGVAAMLIGCQDTSAPEPGVSVEETTQTTFNEAGAPTIRIEVPGIHCESCVEQVTEALSSQSGVTDVIVSLEDKIATVAVDEETFDTDDAIATLVDYQFPESKVIEEEAKSSE